MTEKILIVNEKFSKMLSEKERDLSLSVQKCLEARIENESIKESYRELENAFYAQDQHKLVLEYKSAAENFQRKLEIMTDAHRDLVN